MNLPVINRKIKDHHSGLKEENSGFGLDWFGLGYKFQNIIIGNINANLKLKQNDDQEHINPAQTVNHKPLTPNSIKLQSLQKSTRYSYEIEIACIQRFKNSKEVYRQDILKKSGYNLKNHCSNNAPYLMRRQVVLSTQKISINYQVQNMFFENTTIQQKQTLSTELQYKVQPDCKINSQLQYSQKEHLKQIRQPRKLEQKEHQSKIQYLQSSQDRPFVSLFLSSICFHLIIVMLSSQVQEVC